MQTTDEENRTNGADTPNVRSAREALAETQMMRILKECHDTTEGAAIRVLLWSFFNDKTACNLWDRVGDLSDQVRGEMGEMFKLSSDLREQVVYILLEDSGEMDRVDSVPLPCRNWERSLYSSPAEKEA